MLNYILISVDGPSDEEDDDDEGSGLNDKQPRQEPSTTEPVPFNLPLPSVGSIIHSNYPYLCEIYKDPENQMDKVLVAVSMPGGAHNIKMELNNDGTAVIWKYSWARIMYDMNDMFKKEIIGGQITSYHPKVLCFKNGLERRRHRIDADPHATITITLPIKVQTGEGTWKKSGALRADGSQVVTADFFGFVKDYNKKIADENVVFDQ